MFYLVYQDDGLLGICGQEMSITSPWRKLFIVETMDKMREVLDKAESDLSRRRPRINFVFTDDALAGGDPVVRL